MALDQIAIKSRPKLLLIAGLGLLMMNVREFFSLNRGFASVASIVGSLLFFVVLWNLTQTYAESSTEPEEPRFNPWKVPTLAITGTAFLLISRFLHLKPLLHGLADIAGWLLLLASWSFPRSRWQALTFACLYLVLLSQVRWREFAVFSAAFSNHIYVTIALATLWLTISALIYLFLSRRKPTLP